MINDENNNFIEMKSIIGKIYNYDMYVNICNLARKMLSEITQGEILKDFLS